MGRIRSIHPEACESEDLSRLSSQAERTFWRLLTATDDEGRGRDHPRLLAAKLYPLDDTADGDQVERDLVELAKVGIVVRYEVGGESFYAIPSWDRWQQPDKARPSVLPPPPGWDDTAALTAHEMRRVRQEAGWSLRRLATAVGVAHSHLSRVERGHEFASRDLAQRIREALSTVSTGSEPTVTEDVHGEGMAPEDPHGEPVVSGGDAPVSTGEHAPSVVSSGDIGEGGGEGEGEGPQHQPRAPDAEPAGGEPPSAPQPGQSYTRTLADWAAQLGQPPPPQRPVHGPYRWALDTLAAHCGRDTPAAVQRFERCCVAVLVDFLARIRPDDEVTPGFRKQLLTAVSSRGAPEILARLVEAAEKGAATREGDTLRQLMNYALATADRRPS